MTTISVITDRSWLEEKLWGAKAIADFAGISVDTVYRWEKIPECPISKPGGRYFAMKNRLALWMLSASDNGCAVLPDDARSCVVDGIGQSAP